MTSRVLHPKDIEKATVRVESYDKSGTAFFIFVDNEKQILLTSHHNLPEGNLVKIYIGITEADAEVLERIPECDIAILVTKLQRTSNIAALPLKSIQLPYNEIWETYGFPAQRVNSGARYTGTVSRINEGTKWDVDLECKQYANLDDFSGISGSPLIIEGFAVGVIGYDNVGTLGATGIRKIVEVLQKYGIVVISNKEHSLPESIEEDIASSTPNVDVLQKISKVISDQTSCSYFLISGSPGSGKTTIAAQLELRNENYVIIDRFFVKVPESEEFPTQIRATSEFFMRWIEEVCYRELYNSPPPKPLPETPLNDRILTVNQIIKELSNHYQQQGKIAFLIVDGLDDVNKSRIEDYLSFLSQKLPSNFKIILSCTSKEVLPISIRAEINNSNEIKVTPIPIQQAEKFLFEQLKNKGFNSIQINELAHKSEGHPLYLRYLIKYILGREDFTSIDNWINSIPKIGGEIENYYNKIWQQIQNTDEIWLAATLARLRISIEKETLSELVPEPTKYQFVTSFKKIQHLLRDSDLISIYHTSFSDFIIEKTKEIDTQVHAKIGEFILRYPQTIFGISERVYHLTHSDDQGKKTAIEECNQTWVDDCALNSINPDIVLADIRDVISLAAETGIAHKVISLLLLSQRVNFRYNTLFEENAFFLVNALLALKKPVEAIRYVVRNRTLITSDGDALYLLQRFYEYGANEEAEVLLTAINRTSGDILHNGLNSDSFNRYVQLKFGAVTLSLNDESKNAFEQFMNLKDVLSKFLEKSNNDEQTIHAFKDKVSSQNTGYLIWRCNIPPVTKETENKTKYDNKSSGFIALSIYEALNFQDSSLRKKSVNNTSDWIEDLEYVIDKYGTHPDYHFILLYILLGRTKRIDLIQKLYKEVFTNEEEFSIRKENGVDLDHQSIHRLSLHAECVGFLNVENHFPKLPQNGFSYNWEDNIIAVFKYLCSLKGKIKRYQVDGNSDEIKSLEPKMEYFLGELIPNLSDRMYWDRGYALPELIYPKIYSNLIHLLMDAFPHQLQELVEGIVLKKHYQLGLYREGYINSLFVIARELCRNPVNELLAFKVTKVLEEHIITTIENRWERNEYLLRLVELYALLKNEDRATEIFKEMIYTSMGPSWYKEAHLGIINSAVSNITPKNGDHSYLQKFAAHLDIASGEMTFQRYVKQQQEEFVGDLAKIGFLDKSIAYFKHLLFPNYKIVIDNAESGKVDMPYLGYGYVLGARAIEEQSGMLEMLRSIDCKGSLIAWGLSELFILGDDRYLHGYAKVQANIINYIENNEVLRLDLLLNRLSKFVVTEVDDEYRYEYLNNLFSDLSPTNLAKLKSYLDSVGMNPSKSKQVGIDEEETISFDVKGIEDPLDILLKSKEEAQKKLNVENKSEARKIIIEALKEVQNQKYGIWSFNYSNKINEIRNLLSETYSNSSELIKSLKELIINEPYFEEWIIAKQIVEMLRNIDSEEEKQLILSSVLDHINLMVKTPQQYYDKYSWLNCNTNKVTTDDQQEKILLEFLIWFLNHPSLVVKNRTIEVLTWLGTVMTETIVRALINEIISEGYRISKELSASIIHQISNLHPIGFEEILKTSLEENEKEILGLRHFMIKITLLDTLKECNFQGNLDHLLQKLERTFLVSSKTTGDVVIEEDYLEQISDLLYELNELNILNKEFAETLLDQVKNLSPLPSIKESQKASSYIDRSFNNHNAINLVPDFDTLLRYALNIAINSCVTLDQKEKVADILRFYQPTFPENKIQLLVKPIEEQLEYSIKEIFEENRFDFEKLLLNGDYLLNYSSSKLRELRDRENEKIELTAYLITLDKYSENSYFFPYPSFAENSYCYPHEEDQNMIPLFIKSNNAGNVTGSELVPSEINSFIFKLLPEITNSTTSVYWRRGRNWDNKKQGVSLKTGFFTTIPEDAIIGLKSQYKLIWQINNGLKCRYVDVFEQKEIKI